MADAKNYVAAPSNAIDAQEQKIGQDRPRLMKSTGRAKDSLESQYIEVVDRPVDPEKLAMLAFMEDVVTVYIQPTTNPIDEQVFEVFCNGEREVFKRGDQKQIKRKFANILASQKITTFTQDRRQNSKGIWEDYQIPHTGLRYPFSIMHDPHPRGGDWLRATLSQA